MVAEPERNEERRPPLLSIDHLLPLDERDVSDDDPYIIIEDRRYRVADWQDLSPVEVARVRQLGKRWIEWQQATRTVPDEDDDPDGFAEWVASTERYMLSAERCLPFLVPGVTGDMWDRLSGRAKSDIVGGFFLYSTGVWSLASPSEPVPTPLEQHREKRSTGGTSSPTSVASTPATPSTGSRKRRSGSSTSSDATSRA